MFSKTRYHCTKVVNIEKQLSYWRGHQKEKLLQSLNHWFHFTLDKWIKEAIVYLISCIHQLLEEETLVG